jgi:hypothetical protein
MSIRLALRSIFIFLFLMIVGGSVAGPLEDAKVAYDHRDYATALRFWRRLADQGNAEAQKNLGNMYYHHLAADQGYARAQHNIGNMYSNAHESPHF